MVGLGCQDRIPMMSTLVCMVTYWTKPTLNHELKLSSSYDFTKLLHYVVSQPWENIEFMIKVNSGFDLQVRS